MKRFAFLLVICLLLSGCGAVAPQPYGGSGAEISRTKDPQALSSSAAASSRDVSSDAASSLRAVEEEPSGNNGEYIKNAYVLSVIDDTLAAVVAGEMTGYEKLRAVYRYLIVHVSFFDNRPVGTDVWRYRGDSDDIPTAYEVRSLSPLLFGVASCEDYASAFVTLCARMGFEAKYVPGLTYSVEGELVPHAWAMVMLDGVWYHADPQLEDNIIKADQRLRYRYFLKDDACMSADHRWGALLEDPSEYALALPECPSTYEDTPAETVMQEMRPDRARIEKQLAAERSAFIQSHPLLDEAPTLVLPE